MLIDLAANFIFYTALIYFCRQTGSKNFAFRRISPTPMPICQAIKILNTENLEGLKIVKMVLTFRKNQFYGIIQKFKEN